MIIEMWMGEAEESVSERGKVRRVRLVIADAMPGATGQASWRASASYYRKGKNVDALLEAPEKMQPYQCLNFSPGLHMLDFWT